MARVELNLPEQFYFTTRMSVRFTDLNIGGHVGNDQMISLLAEARSRFLYHFDLEDFQNQGQELVITDLVTIYKQSAYGHDVLQFDVGIMDFNKYGGDFIFRVTRPATDGLIALAKTGFIFVDTAMKKAAPLPDQFHDIFPDAFFPD